MVKRLSPFLLLALAGCHTSPFPDPNDPAQVGILQPIVMQRQLKWASEAANMRVNRGEWTEKFARHKMAEVARKMIEAAPIEKIPEGQAWEYGEIYRTAELWKEAVPIFEIAVKHAPTPDRRVNDTLRLAHCLAEAGQVGEAIKTAESVFDVPVVERAPILPAVYLEIVPGGRGKGKDAELARLLERAIYVWGQTQVDANSDGGALFLKARPYHIREATKLMNALRENQPSE